MTNPTQNPADEERSEPLVSVILVTWNSARYLRPCLAAIRAQTLERIELIAVDNASGDESASIVEETADRVIRNESNLGFSAAVNQALAVARGRFVLLVNPDCRLGSDYAERLAGALEEAGDDFASATGMLVRATGDAIEPTDAIDSLGIRMTRSGRHLDLGQGKPVAEWTSALTTDRRLPTAVPAWEVFGVSGAAALHRSAFLRAVAVAGQPMDEDFFGWREDADLAWRARLSGWRALCVPGAVAWHVRLVTPMTRGALPAGVNMHSVKNRFLLRIKNEGAYLALRNAPFELARDLVVLAASLTVERSSLPAFRWLWRNRARLLEKRREVQRRRRVSDRRLAEWFR